MRDGQVELTWVAKLVYLLSHGHSSMY